eukprot:CAMPEP_0182878680 /NCGR_PEP_ID=MMETSP0034_2-20130328/15503_1 /TAXON_ID=156128 /ORGANISM="Nephroselmis pyriformis, Strain CCMP717" /LENGTH=95 /DNA_ID=CAMNT_0025011575 /DNA_START=42 /DNA_END=327 /DNA_ORIENTATION=-
MQMLVGPQGAMRALASLAAAISRCSSQKRPLSAIEGLCGRGGVYPSPRICYPPRSASPRWWVLTAKHRPSTDEQASGKAGGVMPGGVGVQASCCF